MSGFEPPMRPSPLTPQARMRVLGHEAADASTIRKGYVKHNKNDAADAEAICEAVVRPTMRFVPVKTAEQQAAVLLCRETNPAARR